MSTGGVWVKVNDTNAIRTIFTHKAVGMWAVRDVFGDQGNSDCDCFYPQNWSLNLWESEWGKCERERYTRRENETKNKNGGINGRQGATCPLSIGNSLSLTTKKGCRPL